MPRRTTTTYPDEYAALLGATVVRVADLEGLGMRRSSVARRCRAGGPWRSLVPGIVLLHNAPPTRDERRRAALLHSGSDAVLTGLDALHLAGMRRAPELTGPVHVLIPAGRRRIGYGLVLVERTERMPVPVPGPWPLAPLPRAVLDFARRIRNRDQVRSALAEAVQRGGCTPAQLARELALGSRRGRALPGAVLQEIGDGVRSVAEAKARELVRRSRLPAPLWNPRLVDRNGRFLAIPDAWFDDVGLAWEIDSHEWHLSPQDYDRTLDRRSAMMAEGITVVHTQPTKLTGRGALVLDELERTYAQSRLRPRPPVRAVPATAPNGTFVR